MFVFVYFCVCIFVFVNGFFFSLLFLSFFHIKNKSSPHPKHPTQTTKEIPDIITISRIRSRSMGPYLTMDVDIGFSFSFFSLSLSHSLTLSLSYSFSHASRFTPSPLTALSPELSLSYAHLIAEHARLKIMKSNERIRDVVV
jgi:hypothetical protein